MLEVARAAGGGFPRFAVRPLLPLILPLFLSPPLFLPLSLSLLLILSLTLILLLPLRSPKPDSPQHRPYSRPAAVVTHRDERTVLSRHTRPLRAPAARTVGRSLRWVLGTFPRKRCASVA